MLSVNLILGAIVDILILFYAAKLLSVPKNSSRKAVITVLISFVIGFFIGDILFAMIFSPLIALFLVFAPLVLIAILCIRLFVIKFVYRIGFGKAFSLWLVTAILSIIISFFIPF